MAKKNASKKLDKAFAEIEQAVETIAKHISKGIVSGGLVVAVKEPSEEGGAFGYTALEVNGSVADNVVFGATAVRAGREAAEVAIGDATIAQIALSAAELTVPDALFGEEN